MDSPAVPPPLPEPVANPPRGFWSALGLGLAGAAVMFVTQFLVAAIFGAVQGYQYFVDYHRAMPSGALHQLATNPLLLALCVFATLPTVWAALWVMVRIQRGGRFADFLALRGFRWTQLLIWFPVLALVLFGSQWLLHALGASDDSDFTLNLLLPGPAVPWIIAAIALGAPLVEEPLFRGFMYRGMARSRWTTLLALVIPNCLWVLLHIQYHWPTLIVLFLVGLVLALSRHYSGSTFVPILLHLGMNTFAVVATLSLLHPGLDLSRPSVLACMMQAAAAKKADDNSSAIAAYTQALTLDPKNQEALEKRGLLHQSEDDLDDAVADFTALLRLAPDSARIHYLRADALTDQRDYAAALTDLNRAVALDASAYRAYTLRAYIYDQKNDFKRAIADGQTALRLHPDYLPAIRDLGSAYHDSGDYDHAIKQFDQAVRLAPRSARDRVSRGTAYEWKGDYDHAIADFSEAIRLSPRYAFAYFHRAYCWQQKRAYRKVYLDLTRALEIYPDYTAVANGLAWFLATCPDPIFRDGAQAVRYAEQACRDTHWKNPTYLDTLAAAYAEHGDWDKAVWWQEHTLATTKTPDDMARLRLTRYRHHQAYTE